MMEGACDQRVLVVLKYLLGVGDVKNYDGSGTEWGNLVGAPIEVGKGVATAGADVRCQ